LALNCLILPAMGSLLGHVIPGSLFLLFGLLAFCIDPWGTSDEDKNHRRLMLPHWSLSGLVSISALVMAYFEMVEHSRPSSHNLHHALMYVAFAMFGAADVAERRDGLFPGASNASLVLALLVENVLFLGHPPETVLEGRLHLFLVVTGFAIAAVIARWALAPSPGYLKSMAAFLLCLHGLLFMLIGFWLGLGWPDAAPGFGPKSHGKDLTGPEHIMQAHNLLCLLSMALSAAFAWRLSMAGNRAGSNGHGKDLPSRHQGPGPAVQGKVRESLHDEDDEALPVLGSRAG